MKTVTGLFDTYDEARTAVEALADAGVPSDDISILVNAAPADNHTTAGAGVGAAVGGAAGLLAGLGSFAVPGIGPVVGAGWLATTLAGAGAGGLAGGILGAFTSAGVEDRHSHVYAESIRRGGTFVIARVEDEKVDAAAGIMSTSGSVDVADRQTAFENEGWGEFDPDADNWDPDVAGHPDGGNPIVVPPLPR